MKSLFRWTAILVGVLLLLSVALSVVVMIMFDPNDYKDEIAATVTEQTGRSFTIDGELSLKTFPCCGIRLGPLALGNPPGFPEADFARVESAAVAIQIWPLLIRQELRVGDIELKGFDVQLISRANGANNWDFSSAEAAADDPADDSTAAGGGLASLDIAGIEISNGRLSYSDEAAGDSIEISSIDLTAGAIQMGQPFDLSASLQADGLSPGVTAQIGLTAQATVDADSQFVDMENVSSQLDLLGDDLPGGEARVTLDLDVVRGLGADRVPLEGLAATLQAAGVTVNVQGDGALVANSPELSGSLSVPRFNPRELFAALGEPAPVTADPDVLQRYEMQAKWSFAGDKAAIENIVTTLDDTQIRGGLRVTSLAAEALAFDLELDNIDLDRYMAPAEESAGGESAASAAATGDESLDLPVEDLRALNLQGRLAIGQLKFADARLNDVNINIKAKNGVIRLNPLTAALYGGGYSGDVRMDVSGAKPALSVNENLSGVQLAAMLADLRDQQNLSGLGNVRFKGAASGNSINELLGNLVGDGALDLKDGVYRGTDLWYEIRKARAQLRGKELPPVPEDPHTDISQFDGTAKFANGILNNDRFNAEIPFIRLNGLGDVNLLQSTMDYRLEARVVETPKFEDGTVIDDMNGLVLPITLKGSIDAPKVGVDLTALAVSVGTNKLRDRLMKKLGVEESSGDGATEGAADQPASDQTESQPEQEGAPKSDDPKEQLKKGLLDMLGR